MIRAKSDYGAGLAVKQSPEHNDLSQISRALASISYFVSGSMAVNASQFLGTPLYLINKDWYNAWIAFTKQSFSLLTMTMTQWWAPTVVRVSGDKSVRGQLLKTSNGDLLCNFPQRLVLMANHQIYTDWLFLFWIGYTSGMHGRIYIVLKESLKRIPVLGWGMQFSQFIFLKRKWEQDKPNLAAHMQKLNKPDMPMWLMMFPEGTNLATCTRERSAAWAQKNGITDMEHTLLPRSTGLQFMLQELRRSVNYVYDCTIAYEGVPRGEYAQDIFTVQASYFQGQPPKSVNMHWRRFVISSIPIDDPVAFEVWLRARWLEKDKLMEYYHRMGRFPADTGVDKTPEGKIRRGAGYIETEVKATRWYEFMQIFAPIGLFGLVLYLFYGALPKTLLDSAKKAALDKIRELHKGYVNGQHTKFLLDSASKTTGSGVKEIKMIQNTPKQTVAAQAALQDSGSSRGVNVKAAAIPKPAALATPQKQYLKPLPSPSAKGAANIISQAQPKRLEQQNSIKPHRVPQRKQAPSSISTISKPAPSPKNKSPMKLGNASPVKTPTTTKVSPKSPYKLANMAPKSPASVTTPKSANKQQKIGSPRKLPVKQNATKP